MKKAHMKAMNQSMESAKKAAGISQGHSGHHSDPIVGGVSEDESATYGSGEFANMPSQVKMQAYPKASEYGPTVLDDTMGEIDRSNKMSDSRARSKMSNQH